MGESTEKETWVVDEVGKVPKDSTLVEVLKAGSHRIRIWRGTKKIKGEEIPFLFQENMQMPGVVLSRPDV